MNLPRQDGHSSEVLCDGIFMCRIWPYVLCICINCEHLGVEPTTLPMLIYILHLNNPSHPCNARSTFQVLKDLI